MTRRDARGDWWREPLMRLILTLTMRTLTGEQRRRILLHVADAIGQSQQNERAAWRKAVMATRKDWMRMYALNVKYWWAVKALDDLLAALGRRARKVGKR